MNFRSLAVGTVAACAFAAAADPAISALAVARNENGAAEITYTLSGGTVIVTAQAYAKENGAFVELDPALATNMVGDVNRVVAEGVRRIVWALAKSANGSAFAAGDLRMSLTAWKLDAPPDYMAVDLTVGQTKRFYASAAAVPGGVSNAVYKTRKLLMRKIPAKNVVWRMGTPAALSPAAWTQNNEAVRKVKLTDDYYIGVYPVTQAQYSNAYVNAGMSIGNYGSTGGGDSPSSFKEYGDSPIRPVEKTVFVRIRGNPADSSTYDWPTGTEVEPGKFIGKLRTFTGLAFDLPTSAQWEYACRAGVAGNWYDGSNNSGYDIAWTSSHTYGDGTSATHPVGELKPNDFGLYDMCGNVCEWCLDNWSDGALSFDAGVVYENYKGPETASVDKLRVTRGGQYSYDANYYCRAGAVYRCAQIAAYGGNGFRLFAPATIPAE